MPIDPEDPRRDRRLRFTDPTRMAHKPFDALWEHILGSSRGSVPESDAFSLRAFDAHRFVPKIAVPNPSVHQAALNATKTKPVSTKGKAPVAGTKRKLTRGESNRREADEEDFSAELDQLDDADSWSDISNQNVEDSVTSRSRSRRRTSSSLPRKQDLSQEAEDEQGLHGYHTDSDDSTKDPDWTEPDGHCAKQQTHVSVKTGPTPSPTPSAPKSSLRISYPDPERENTSPYQDQGWQFDPTSESPVSLEWGIDSLFHPDILNVSPDQEIGFNEVSAMSRQCLYRICADVRHFVALVVI